VEIFLLILMLATFAGLAMWLKMPVGFALAITSVVLALAAGHFNVTILEHLINGMFGYLDVSLVLITAMVFMKVIEKNGLLKALTRDLILKFGGSPITFLIVITLLIMFPGAITGSCAASVLSTGVLLAPVLLQLNMPRHIVGAIITMAAVYGMIAPPVNIIVMIIGAGMDVPYLGFNTVLLLITVPLAISTTLYLGYSYAKKADLQGIVAELRVEKTESSFLLYSPLMVMLLLMIVPKVFPQSIPDPGMPPTFLVAIIIAIFTGRKFKVPQAVKQGVSEILPVVSLLIGVGMLIEIMTLIGLRGFIVVNMLSIPAYLMLVGIVVSMPLFGGISVFGSASVLGVPFALALLGSNQIITISALSLIAAMGSFMPPVALTPTIAAQVIGEPSYGKLIRPCLVPIIFALIVGVLMLVFADPIAKIIF